MTNQKAHDNLIDEVARRLKKSRLEYTIEKKLIYGNKDRDLGELDLIAKRPNYQLIFEMKSVDSQNNYCKAVEQLTRAKRYYPNNRTFLFYVSPEGIEIVYS